MEQIKIWEGNKGSCICTLYNNGRANVMVIDSLEVFPEYREQGVGTALMKQAIKIAKRNKVGAVELLVNEDNVAAKGLYEKMGFKCVPRKNYYRLILNTELKDLTVIMMTPNKVPDRWAAYQKETLLEAIGDTPLIIVSNKPMDWGTHNLIQTEYSLTNIFIQMLRAAKLANTPYVAIADDDTVYPKEHFDFRPPLDTFAYNFNRWHIFTWRSRRRAYYFYKPRPGNGLMIAPRELLIKVIEARFARLKRFIGHRTELFSALAAELGTHGEGQITEFFTYVPVLSCYHTVSIDSFNQHRSKRPWPVQAFDLPGWGPADIFKRHWR